MIAVMLGLLVILYFSMQQILQDYILTRLRADTESLVSVAQLDQNKTWSVNPTQMSTVYDRVKSGHYYRLSTERQTITSRSLFDVVMPMPSSPLVKSGHYLAQGPGHEVWLVRYQQVNKNSQLVNIWIAENITPLRQQLIRYSAYAVILLLITTSILIYLQRRTLERSFRIFEDLRQNLSSVRHREIEKTGLQVPWEIMPLVNEIEILVDQLRNRINRTRHAIGNLAHELKRPIQLLSLQQELDGSSDQIKPLLEIRAILERELKRAKISGSQGAGGTFNINEELPYMINILAKIYPLIEIKFENTESIQTLDLDRDDMLELTGNILDNACKFASHLVRLQIVTIEQSIKLIFDDDGRGIEQTDIEAVKKRGVRLDESHEGHGLGLSICRDIIKSYYGDMSFTSSPMGGLRVSVTIPLKS